MVKKKLKIAVKDQFFFRKGGFSQKRLNLRYKVLRGF